MDFSDALREMKCGKRVRRLAWGGEESLRGAHMKIIPLPAPFEPQIMVGYANSDVIRSFTGSHWDLLADDWITYP